MIAGAVLMSDLRLAPRPRGVLLWLLVLCCLISSGQAARADAPSVPLRCKVGGYVSALREIDTGKETFNADVWLWSICPEDKLEPLKSMEFTNAVQVAGSLDSSQARPGGVWKQRKIVGRFKADLDLRNYPFDRHKLVVGLEEATADTSGLVYIADNKNSGVNLEEAPNEWKITGFRTREGEHVWRTNFGDPLLPVGAESRYTHMDLVMDVARSDPTTFFRIAIPVYVAAGLALISLLMQIEDGRNILNPRLGLLAACLFAVVFNLNAANDALGNPPYLTLVDGINLSALVLILFATAAAVASGMAADRGVSEARLRRLDYLLLATGAITFIVANVVMVMLARGAG